MKLETAIKVLKADAQFLGMSFRDFIQYVGKNPLAQTQEVMTAYRVYVIETI